MPLIDMRPAEAQECPNGHRYYREQSTQTQCPHCLLRKLRQVDVDLELLATGISKARAMLVSTNRLAPSPLT